MIVAFDIETTGLDPETDQILEIAAVVYQPDQESILGMPYFVQTVSYDRVCGSPKALAMNSRLIDKMAAGYGAILEEALLDFGVFLRSHLEPGARATLLGKGVGRFDLQFMKVACKEWAVNLPLDYRVIDVDAYLVSNNSDTIESLGDVVKLGNLQEIPGDLHTALHDARMSLALAMDYWTK